MHEVRNYTCNKCDFQVSSKERFKIHQEAEQYLNIHKNNKHVKYSCFKCDFQARGRGKLTAHKQSKHEGLSPIKARRYQVYLFPV